MKTIVQNTIVLTVLLAFTLACVQQPDSGKRQGQGSSLIGSGSDSAGNGSGGGAKPTPGGIDGVVDDSPPTVEILNFVDPYTGTLKPKLTLPKNFRGKLSIQGINLSTLSPYVVKVRFRFGLNREPIELDGLISTAPGLTPQTRIQVLTVDFKTRPFQDLRLLYDLYDYNDYDFGCQDTNQNGVCDGDGTKRSIPITDNRNNNLFCRGLRLEDESDAGREAVNCDPNTKGQGCLYSYAKVVDKGLVRLAQASTSTTPILPSEPQIDLLGFGYYQNIDEELLKRCLPERPRVDADLPGDHIFASKRTLNFMDTPDTFTPTAILDYGVNYTGTSTSLYFQEGQDPAEFVYDGPFRAIHYSPMNTGIWQLPEHAIFGKYGLFTGHLSSSVDMASMDPLDNAAKIEAVRTGTGSLLFPRYGRLNLTAGTRYWGASDTGDPDEIKQVRMMSNNGLSNYVDGCNLRVTHRDPVTKENIASCNVTAEIEIVVLDDDGNDKNRKIISKDLKLQVVRPASIDDDGSSLPDVLFDGFKYCSNTSACGSNECCYNNRCWSKKYVSKCSEDNVSIGFREVGQSCTSDFQCGTLCCDGSTATCQPHDPNAQPPVLCEKPFGQRCIATDWCRQVSKTEYYIIDEGVDELGRVQCSLQGYNVIKFAECRNGLCVDLPNFPVPPFNPDDPDRCNNAQDPPSF